MLLRVGLDSTDDSKGGCTTHVLSRVVRLLIRKEELRFLDFPRLVRLNPNIPWKTRGNGAVAVVLSVPENLVEEVVDSVSSLVESLTRSEETSLIFYKGVPSRKVRKIAQEALYRAISLREAEKVLEEERNILALWNGSRKGLIGALAAIGYEFSYDYTFELLAYRVPENYGKPRRVSRRSVLLMDEKTRPYTFNNIDHETGRILITPHGPDPVLVGIRGETPESVFEAYKLLEIEEPVEGWLIFKTNQGTNEHLRKKIPLRELQLYVSAVVEGTLIEDPRVIRGGHVIAKLSDGEASIYLAAYKETGEVNEALRLLRRGDVVEAYGGVKRIDNNMYTLNLEALKVLRLCNAYLERAPKCPRCKKAMKSLGKDKGYRCKKCGYVDAKATKVRVYLKREVAVGRLFLPPPRSHRHLTKPRIRYSMRLAREDAFPPKVPWCFFNE